MIKLVVFDMAGTTIDEDNIVYKTLQGSINDQGFDFTLDQVLAEGAGREKLQAVKGILKAYAGNTDEKLSENIYVDFIGRLTKAYDKLDVLPQPGAIELFLNLRERNIRIVLNTGYDSGTAESLIGKLGWQKGIEYDLLISASDVLKNRPDPEMIELAMEKFGIENPKEVIKVGDSVIDIEEGQNAGCLYSIGITSGAHSYTQLLSASPDFIINHLIELLPIVDRAGS
jgi:phosphonatase-like hydrolase